MHVLLPRMRLALAAALVGTVTACEPQAIDGRGNNVADPEIGAAGTALFRLAAADYGDGLQAMAGAQRPSPRAISNAVCAQSGSIPNRVGASDFVWQWGQFLDHDIDLTVEASPAEAAHIPVPACDLHFDPNCTGRALIPLLRSAYHPDTGRRDPRQQLNEITAWIDASNVYGSDPTRQAALRMNDGSGRLRTSAGRLLPFNTGGLPNAGGSDEAALFLAGDVRANEQVALTALHTLFVREHNYLARRIAGTASGRTGDQIYETARALVSAEMQVITYREFLPVLLGKQALRPYQGYRPDVDAGIANEFSGAAYRFGHSMLSPTLLQLDRRGREIDAGHLPLRDAFFAPEEILEVGIEPLLRGLAAQFAQEVDPFVIDDVRNFLFGPPGSGGFDLAALNLQRGRDHGLPSYNDTREAMGLPRARGFADVSSDPEIQRRLAAVYDHVDDVDLWVGGLAEDHVPGTMVGELFRTILADQFERLRDGDRFWYQRRFPPAVVRLLERTGLADIIRRNTHIGPELSRDVFRVGRAPSRPGP